MRVWVRTVAARLLATLAAIAAEAPDARAESPSAPARQLPAPAEAAAAKAPPAAKPLAGCAGWLGRARTLRDGQRLLDARDALAHCSEARCEASVRKECSIAYKELEQRIPQLVLRVKTFDGGHIDQARAYVDGRPALPDTVIELDPGPHAVRTHHDDYIGRESQVTLASGERRILVVELRERAPVIDDGGARARFSNWPMPEAAWALVGASVGAFATAIVLDAYTAERVENLKKCAPNCDENLVAMVERDIQLSRLAAGLGVLSLATAAWMALAEGAGDTTVHKASYAPLLKVTGGPGGAKATLTARFDETEALGVGSTSAPPRAPTRPGAPPEFHPPRGRTPRPGGSESTTCSKGCSEPPPPPLDEPQGMR
jgi:hypothetical protein